jgi:hypothetical protein
LRYAGFKLLRNNIEAYQKFSSMDDFLTETVKNIDDP